MATENETRVDRLWRRLRNNRYVALVVVGAGVATSIASFSDGFLASWRTAEALFPTRQRTQVHTSPRQPARPPSSATHRSPYAVAASEDSDWLTLSKDKVVVEFTLQNQPGNFSYTLHQQDNQLVIAPYNAYLTNLAQGKRLTPVNYRWTPFEFQFPTLDFQVINRSATTIFFTKAVLQVARSGSDPFPLLLFNEGYNMCLPLQNVGWSAAHRCKLRFALVPIDQPLEVAASFPYEYVIGEFTEGARSIDLRPYFSALGVQRDVLEQGYVNTFYQAGEQYYTVLDDHEREMKLTSQAYAQRLQAARGPFLDGAARIVGELQFEGTTAAGQRVPQHLPFTGTIHLGDAVAGAPAPPRFEYTVALEADQDHYQKEVVLARAVQPHEMTHFQLKLFAPRSSRHHFTLRLLYNEDQELTIPNMALNYLMTRADSLFVRGVAQLANTARQTPQ